MTFRSVFLLLVFSETDGEKTVNNWFNASDFRRIVMTNTLAATLRYDVFNLTNRATITSLAGDPRSMQFSVRLEF